MGQYKYKLNEVPSVEKDEKFKIGDTKISRELSILFLVLIKKQVV